MILTLAASIMYWSLQKAVEDGESSPSPSPSNGTCTATPDASPAPSVSGEDEISSLGGEVSNLNIDDAASDTTVSSQLVNEEFTAVEWNMKYCSQQDQLQWNGSEYTCAVSLHISPLQWQQNVHTIGKWRA